MKYAFTARDRTIESTLGHVLFFQKGVPQHVPPELVKTVLDMGAEAVDDEALAEAAKVMAPAGAKVEPTDPNARAEALAEAIALLVEAGKREAFTAGGAPHVKALNELLGWTPSSEERDTAWLAFQANKD